MSQDGQFQNSAATLQMLQQLWIYSMWISSSMKCNIAHNCANCTPVADKILNPKNVFLAKSISFLIMVVVLLHITWGLLKTTAAQGKMNRAEWRGTGGCGWADGWWSETTLSFFSQTGLNHRMCVTFFLVPLLAGFFTSPVCLFLILDTIFYFVNPKIGFLYKGCIKCVMSYQSCNTTLFTTSCGSTVIEKPPLIFISKCVFFISIDEHLFLLVEHKNILQLR